MNNDLEITLFIQEIPTELKAHFYENSQKGIFNLLPIIEKYLPLIYVFCKKQLLRIHSKLLKIALALLELLEGLSYLTPNNALLKF